jgi:hypothetical protein
MARNGKGSMLVHGVFYGRVRDDAVPPGTVSDESRQSIADDSAR